MGKLCYTTKTNPPTLSYRACDFALAVGRKITPATGSAMLVLAILAQAAKDDDEEFLVNYTVNYTYYTWFGIKDLGLLFQEARINESSQRNYG